VKKLRQNEFKLLAQKIRLEKYEVEDNIHVVWLESLQTHPLL
jgi:hypothetical protein